MATLTFTGELTVVTCWCGCVHAVPSELRRYQLAEHANGRRHNVYCPLGHQYAPSGETETTRLGRQLAIERSQHDQTKAAAREAREQRDAAIRRENAQKGAKTRIKNRVQKGVCPCCNRTFVELQRHMATQHPEWAATEEVK